MSYATNSHAKTAYMLYKIISCDEMSNVDCLKSFYLPRRHVLKNDVPILTNSRHHILRSDMSFNDIMIICMMEVYKNSTDEDIKHLQWNDFFDNYLQGYTRHVGINDEGKYGFMNNIGDTIFYNLPNTIELCLPQFTGYWHGVPYG